MKEEKYTLRESAIVFVMAAIMVVGVSVVMFPLLLLTAWMRETAWNWYCASFHLPHVSLWLMLIVGLFASTFSPHLPIHQRRYAQVQDLAE